MDNVQQPDKPTIYYVNSFHTKTDYNDAVCVIEKHETTDESGTKHYKNVLKVYPNPMRPFWITKPAYRNHSYKKEFEELSKLEEYRCKDSDLERALASALGVYESRYLSLPRLCSSPYVYGADISTEVLIKQHYLHRQIPGKIPPFTKGGFDIESEVRGEKRINIITFISEHEIYTCALREYCRVFLGKDQNGEDQFRPTTEDEIIGVIWDTLGEYLTKYNFHTHFKICDTELDLITWIFQCIHKEKTDFIGVWNLGFDIPHILDRLHKMKLKDEEIEAILCHPEVPKAYRCVDWHEDKMDVQHFTDKWHWFTCAGYSQFLDSMCLYARLRKVYGRDSSYSLDDISTKELGQGKLHFGAITNHWYQQRYNFLKYIAYNVNDVLIMQLMEWQNDDMGTLYSLSGNSLISQFSRQTVMLRNDAFEYAIHRGHVPASAGSKMFTEYDDELSMTGGTVLPPNKAERTGTKAVAEMPDTETLVSVFTNDLDVSSFYPSVTEEFNISKESALATVISINGYPQRFVEHMMSCIVQPEVSAVDLCTTYYNLPSFFEIEDIFDAEQMRKKNNTHVTTPSNTQNTKQNS